MQYVRNGLIIHLTNSLKNKIFGDLHAFFFFFFFAIFSSTGNRSFNVFFFVISS